MRRICMIAMATLLGSTALVQAETLRFAYAQNATPTKEAMARFAELVDEKTDGDLTVQFFPDSQLGGERELVEQVQAGLLDMTKVSSGLMESFDPIYGTFSMPYLFDDTDHYYAVLDDPEIMTPVYESTKERGIVGLTYYDSGARSFYVKGDPILKVEDLAGKKIRVMQSPTSIRMVELLGGSPIAMGQDEVYTAIQQGILDGAENNIFAITVARHGEVVDNMSFDEHTRIPDVVLISTAALDRLDDDQRKAVREAAVESTAYHKELWADAVNAEREKATEDFGITYHEVDKAPFQKAVQPIYDDLSGDQAELVEKIRAKSANTDKAQ